MTAMLRRASEDDAERIAELHTASWRVTYTRELPPSFLETQDVGARAASWRSQMEEGVRVFVAEDGEEMTGFVACGPARDKALGQGIWEIYNLHVAPKRKREGIGSALFRSAVELGREEGATDLVLWVVVSNSTARLFYELKGMECEGTRQESVMRGGHKLYEIRYRMRLSDCRP